MNLFYKKKTIKPLNYLLIKILDYQSVTVSKVVLFTTLELYSEEATINHHGFARSVAGHGKEASDTGSRGTSPHQIAKMFGNIAIYHNILHYCFQRSR